MGRVKIDIKRIENQTTRKATFCKRRAGLFKKAKELSVLCDAEIAVLIISRDNKYFQFASADIENIIQRYSKLSEQIESRDSIECSENNHNKNQNIQVSEVKFQAEQLQMMLKLMVAQDLAKSDSGQLQQLEEEMDLAITQLRAAKNQAMLRLIEERMVNERNLIEENQNLKKMAETTVNQQNLIEENKDLKKNEARVYNTVEQLQLMLENLTGLDAAQLQELEEKMELGIVRVRARRNAAVRRRIEETTIIEQKLIEENRFLRMKMADVIHALCPAPISQTHHANPNNFGSSHSQIN